MFFFYKSEIKETSMARHWLVNDRLIIGLDEPRGVHPPETMMHFPPVSDFPLFSKKFQTRWKIFKMLPFPEKFLDFHPPSDDFF